MFGTWVYGLNLDIDRHVQQLIVCGKNFSGTPVAVSSNMRALHGKPDLPTKITVVADDYFSSLKEAKRALISKVTDRKTADG
jgi:hypothetical protein